MPFEDDLSLSPAERLKRAFEAAPDWTPESDPEPEPAQPPAPDLTSPTFLSILREYMDKAGEWTPPPDPVPAPGGRALPRIISLAELAELPPPSWRITGIVPKGVLSCVFGPPGAGKSFLVLDWALCVATGRPWAGHTTTPGPVAYIAAEGHSGLDARVAAWEEANGPARDADVGLLLAAANLLDPSAVDEVLGALAADLGRLEDIALIIVDTLARSMIGGDENSARDMGLLIAACDRLRRATNATVILVHHTGKNGLIERGSSALRGACDMMTAVFAEDSIITLKCEKMKDAPPFPLSRWTLAPRGASCVLVPSDVVLANPNRDLSPAQRQVLEALGGPVLGGSATSPDLREALNMPSTTLYRALSALMQRGFVEDAGPAPNRSAGKLYQLTEAGANML